MERGLDFKKSNVQELTLPELTSTIHENYSNGLPCGGIYHYQLIETLLEELAKAGFSPEVDEIFAANNRDRYRPGVSIDERIANERGENAFEAFTLRRVYANVKCCEMDKEGMHMNMAIAYHQLGIQVAFGPLVRICHNQTILGAKDVFTTQNISNSSTVIEASANLNEMLGKIRSYITDLSPRVEEINEMVTVMQEKPFYGSDFEKILAILMEARVRHDSAHHLIHRSTDYALSSSQINAALERYFIEKESIDSFRERHETAPELSWWHALNIFNQDLKPAECVIPSIISQSFGLGHIFWNSLSNKL